MKKFIAGLSLLMLVGCTREYPLEKYVAICDGKRWEISSSAGYFLGANGCVSFLNYKGWLKIDSRPVATICGCNAVGRVLDEGKKEEGK